MIHTCPHLDQRSMMRALFSEDLEGDKASARLPRVCINTDLETLKELRVSISRAEAWACCEFPMSCHNVRMQFRQQQHSARRH